MERQSLSASQLDQSGRSSPARASSSSQRLASNGHHRASSTPNNLNDPQQFATTQRLLKVMQSHPIQRPDAHFDSPTSHDAPPRVRSVSPVHYAPAASSFAPSSSFHSHSRASETAHFDVLSSFKRELERVRRDVDEDRRTESSQQSARMAGLAATAPAGTQLHPPSTISAMLHSPKLGRMGGLNGSMTSSRPAAPLASSAFGLAPARHPSPYLASDSTGLGNDDPHVQSLLSRGASLLGSQSSALDQSRARLDALLSGLHHWKSVQSGQLQQRVHSIEHRHALELRALTEKFELEKSQLESRARSAIEEAVRAHKRAVEQHVEELNTAVEREFRQTGSISQAFAPPQPQVQPASSSSLFASSLPSNSPARSNHRHYHHHGHGHSHSHSHKHSHSHVHSSSASSSLGHSLRLEHLDQGAGSSHSHRRSSRSSDDDDEDEADKESSHVADQRRKLQYGAAISGAGATALSRSLPTSSSGASARRPSRATVAAVLYSSDEEEDAETRTRRQLVEQAQFLHSKRQRQRESAVSASLGISGRSRGRSGQRRRAEEEAVRAQQQEARRMLESSSDEEEAESSRAAALRLSASGRRPGHASTVTFAATPTKSPRASESARASRSATGASNSALTPGRRREREQAAQVYGAVSSDEEEREERAAKLRAEAPLARASSGRLVGTPAAQAPSLTQLSHSFHERVRAIRQAGGGRVTSEVKSGAAS